MKALVIGAHGFIGRHIARALQERGHDLIAAGRSPRSQGDKSGVAVDFSKDLTVADWLPRLVGVDLVINSVGIVRETPANRFATVHSLAPQALFAACARLGVKKVIHISALGADAAATTAYHLTKKAAEDFLAGLDLDWTILQASLVHGSDGASSRYFRMLASLPLLAVPGNGEQRVQPVHIDDLCLAVLRCIEDGTASRQRIAVVGPHSLSYRDMLLGLRRQLGLPPPWVVKIPLALLQVAAMLTERLPSSLLTRDTLSMLNRGNTADPQPMELLLGRMPRPLSAFIPESEVSALRMQARLDWLMPIIKVALALMWLGSGIVSLGLFPVGQSLALLLPFGLTGMAAYLTLFGLASMDIVLGVLILTHGNRRLWQVQFLVVAGYTALIGAVAPAHWLHPFGPLLKNIPILSVLLMLIVLAEAP